MSATWNAETEEWECECGSTEWITDITGNARIEFDENRRVKRLDVIDTDWYDVRCDNCCRNFNQ